MSVSEVEEKAFVFPLGHRNFPSLYKFTPHRQRWPNPLSHLKSASVCGAGTRLRSDSEKLIKSVEGTAATLPASEGKPLENG